MAVEAAALETYDMTTIREDLTDQENMISPTETPFQSMIAGSGKAKSVLHEWPMTELGAVDSANRVIEGDDAPPTDNPVVSSRRSNYTQISDKKVRVTDTSQVVDAAANINDLAKQITYKLRELKRDKETMFLAKIIAAPGASGTARQSAGLYAFIITNRDAGGSTAPALSGTTSGYPSSVGTGGTGRALTEVMFNAVMQSVWTQGGDAKYALVSAINKRLISTTFTANATRFKDADDRNLISAIDIYESDFGKIKIIADRFTLGSAVYIIDPEYVKICTLMATRQIPLARTGHSEARLIQSEYTLEVGNEKALGIVADTLG